MNSLIGIFAKVEDEKSTGLGPELVSNGDFSSDTIWTKGAGCTISGGEGVMAAAGDGMGFTQNLGIVTGKMYRVKMILSGYTSGAVACGLGGTSGVARNSIGTYQEDLKCGGTVSFGATASGTSTLKVDFLSVKEIVYYE